MTTLDFDLSITLGSLSLGTSQRTTRAMPLGRAPTTQGEYSEQVIRDVQALRNPTWAAIRASCGDRPGYQTIIDAIEQARDMERGGRRALLLAGLCELCGNHIDPDSPVSRALERIDGVMRGGPYNQLLSSMRAGLRAHNAGIVDFVSHER